MEVGVGSQNVRSCPWVVLRLSSCGGEFGGIEAGERGFGRHFVRFGYVLCESQWCEMEEMESLSRQELDNAKTALVLSKVATSKLTSSTSTRQHNNTSTFETDYSRCLPQSAAGCTCRSPRIPSSASTSTPTINHSRNQHISPTTSLLATALSMAAYHPSTRALHMAL